MPVVVVPVNRELSVRGRPGQRLLLLLHEFDGTFAGDGVLR